MTYTIKSCQHGWLDPRACKTCNPLAEVPVREWVGLTPAEIMRIDAATLGSTRDSPRFAQAIEAALKTKNTPEKTS